LKINALKFSRVKDYSYISIIIKNVKQMNKLNLHKDDQKMIKDGLAFITMLAIAGYLTVQIILIGA